MAAVRLVGEGGVEWEYDLPLREVFADQVKTGKLRPADSESRDALAELLAPLEVETSAELDPPKELTLAERIADADTHAKANVLAEELGVDGFEEKKPSLDVKRTALHEAAAAAAA